MIAKTIHSRKTVTRDITIIRLTKCQDVHNGPMRWKWTRAVVLVLRFGLLALSALFLTTTALDAAETNTPKESPPFNAPQYDWVLASHQHGGGTHGLEDTNVPFLKLSWFLGAQEVFYYDVWADGRAGGGLSTLRGHHGGGGRTFDPTNFAELASAVASLPPPPKLQPPKERWLLVSGNGSHQWFTYIYDRRAVPLEVERLFEITGAHLQWALPNVNSSTNIPAVPFRSLTRHTVLWNLQKQQEIKLPTILDGNVSSSISFACSISEDGKIAACSEANGNYAFDCASGKILWQKPPFRASHLAIVENDKVLVLALANSAIEEWDLATGEKLDSLASELSGIEAMTASRDGRLLAVCSRDGKIRVWDLQRKAPPKILADSTWLSCLEFSPDGRYLAACGWNYRNAVGIWDWQAEKKIRTRHYWNTPRPDPASSLAWSPDGKLFAVQPGKQQVVIFDAESWQPLATWGPAWVDGGPQVRLAFSADGMLIGQLDDGALQILDVPTLKRIEAKEFK
ncbi:MAG: WD40 repeat domain-containing protein [Limisphaerales bacterium]